MALSMGQTIITTRTFWHWHRRTGACSPALPRVQNNPVHGPYPIKHRTPRNRAFEDGAYVRLGEAVARGPEIGGSLPLSVTASLVAGVGAEPPDVLRRHEAAGQRSGRAGP